MRVAVKIIAWVYLAAGIAGGFGVIYAILFGGPRNDVGELVLFLLLGYGLMHFHPLARGVALLLSVFGLFVVFIGLVLCIGHVAGLIRAYSGLIVDQPVLAFVALGGCLAFASCQLWVLTRPEIAALFKKPSI
ncbi:MAG TPA: hypothetical protein VGP76_00075 [Planctomycetaceae bacterium]|jgi:hypothetical protein|nr:hypothetical protein [Planctomycetaceae bacterium]